MLKVSLHLEAQKLDFLFLISTYGRIAHCSSSTRNIMGMIMLERFKLQICQCRWLRLGDLKLWLDRIRNF